MPETCESQCRTLNRIPSCLIDYSDAVVQDCVREMSVVFLFDVLSSTSILEYFQVFFSTVRFYWNKGFKVLQVTI